MLAVGTITPTTLNAATVRDSPLDAAARVNNAHVGLLEIRQTKRLTLGNKIRLHSIELARKLLIFVCEKFIKFIPSHKMLQKFSGMGLSDFTPSGKGDTAPRLYHMGNYGVSTVRLRRGLDAFVIGISLKFITTSR